MRKTAPQELIDWLVAQLEQRSWGVRETARRAGVSHPTISDILNLGVRPSFDTCVKLAGAFRTDPVMVVRLAGLLPPAPEADHREAELLHAYRQLAERDKREIVEIARLKIKLGKGSEL